MIRLVTGLRTSTYTALSILMLLGVTPVHADAPAFTSRYTDLNKDCGEPKWISKDRAAWERKHPGEEYPDPEIMDCTPIGGWRLTMNWSAATMALYVGPQTKGRDYTKDTLVGNRLAAGTKYPALEWRMVADKPFAVIFRTAEWQDNPESKPDGSSPQFVVTAEKLVVRGLGRYASLKLELPAKDPLANQKARAAADAAYTSLNP